MLAKNMEDQEEKLLSLAYNSIRKRVAETLVELSLSKKKTENSDQLNLTILREDLANMVGTAKESVIRTLTDFKHEGLVKIDHGKFL